MRLFFSFSDLELAQGNGHSQDEFEESQENHLPANSYLEPSFSASILRSMSTPIASSNVADQKRQAKVEEKEHQPDEDENTSDSRGKDEPRSTSSIDGSSLMSPFAQNSYLPSHPAHNGWIPKNTKQWTPGAYRSAFYTPDTRLIKFTIKDRVNGGKLNKKRPQVKHDSVNTRDNTLLNSDGTVISQSIPQPVESSVNTTTTISPVMTSSSSTSSS